MSQEQGVGEAVGVKSRRKDKLVQKTASWGFQKKLLLPTALKCLNERSQMAQREQEGREKIVLEPPQHLTGFALRVTQTQL